MQSRILFINCPSEYFLYVSMGTFGVCDYLRFQSQPFFEITNSSSGAPAHLRQSPSSKKNIVL